MVLAYRNNLPRAEITLNFQVGMLQWADVKRGNECSSIPEKYTNNPEIVKLRSLET